MLTYVGSSVTDRVPHLLLQQCTCVYLKEATMFINNMDMREPTSELFDTYFNN